MPTRAALAATIATAAAAAALIAPAGAAAYTPVGCAPGCDLVVNTTVDEPDVGPGDGACATAAGDCTLRAAVQEANADPAHEHEILVPRGNYVLSRHGLDDDASHGDLDIHFRGQIVGAGQSRTVLDGDDADRVFDIGQLGEISISHFAIRHGRATDGPGGGIRTHNYPVHLSYLYVTDNEAVPGDAEGSGDGGGIAALTETDINHVQLAYNHAVDGAGLWWSGIQGSFNSDAFVGNHATGDGGGIYLSGGDDQAWSLTLSANTAGGHGGGVFVAQHNGYGGYALAGSTIATNSAPHNSGGGLWIEGDPADLGNLGLSGLIVADNADVNCAGPGTTSSGGGNVEDGDTCGFSAASDQTNTDPLIDNLAYNGGPTPTRALLDGSPAIDAWPCGGFGSSTDQRGVTRPQGAACDSGAFEVGKCCPEYDAAYVPPTEQPPPPPKEGSCGVLRFGTQADDLLVGDRRKNQIYGRGGDDHIFGRYQADCLYGGRGDDFIRGGEGTDLLVGFTGADHLSGGDEEDVVRGGRGNDRILGGADEDRLFGGPGADYLKGGDGYDTIAAGPGDDTIDATGHGLDTVDCGSGDDHVRAKRDEHLTGCEHVHYVD